MRKSYWLYIGLALLIATGTAFADFTQVSKREQADTRGKIPTVVQEIQMTTLDEAVPIWGPKDFESGMDDWTFYDEVAQTDFYWTTDTWEAYAGSYSWRCFDPTIGDNGGYGSSWIQWLNTPNVAAGLTTAPTLSFYFRMISEIGSSGTPWDGGAVWVYYGADADNLTSALLEPATGPAYLNDVGAFSVLDHTNGWSGVYDTWTEVTMDLTPYVSYDYVKVVFLFASDSNTEEGFGMMIDDIDISDGATSVFSDDAEDVANSEMIATAGIDLIPNVWGIHEPGDAPSPTQVMGVVTDERDFTHYMISEEITIPELLPGEDMLFDCMFSTDMYYDGDAGLMELPFFRVEVWDPENEQWDYATNIRNWRGPNSNYVTAGSAQPGWHRFSEYWATDWTVPNEMAGLEGVKIRFGLYMPTPIAGHEDDFFDFVYFDDIALIKNSLEHDIATGLYIPYPTTVGVNVPGYAIYTNLGVNEEDIRGLWGFEVPTMPVVNGMALHVGVGEFITANLTTDEGATEGWIPTAPGPVVIAANSIVAGDQVPENNVADADVNVLAEGSYELGLDSHSRTGFLSATIAQNSGILLHIDPASISDVFTDMGALNITGIKGVFNLFYHPDLGFSGMPENGCEMGFHIYGGGADAPGALLHELVYTFPQPAGTSGNVEVDIDVSSVDALQNYDGDLWLYAEFLTPYDPPRAAHMCPFPLLTTPGPHQEDIYLYDGTDLTAVAEDAWVLSIVVEAYNEVETVDSNIPTKFALNNAYPNPFNPSTAISFDVANASHVSLKVYNLMGQEVASLVDRQMTTGAYKTTFDAAALSSGVYFVRMQAGSFNAVQKVMLMK